MELQPGMADPIFMHELAEHLHMTVGDVGRRATAHEVTVGWPLYFEWKAKQQSQAQGDPESLTDLVRGMGS
jgi:hypothetical protein